MPGFCQTVPQGCSTATRPASMGVMHRRSMPKVPRRWASAAELELKVAQQAGQCSRRLPVHVEPHWGWTTRVTVGPSGVDGLNLRAWRPSGGGESAPDGRSSFTAYPSALGVERVDEGGAQVEHHSGGRVVAGSATEAARGVSSRLLRTSGSGATAGSTRRSSRRGHRVALTAFWGGGGLLARERGDGRSSGRTATLAGVCSTAVFLDHVRTDGRPQSSEGFEDDVRRRADGRLRHPPESSPSGEGRDASGHVQVVGFESYVQSGHRVDEEGTSTLSALLDLDHFHFHLPGETNPRASLRVGPEGVSEFRGMVSLMGV